MSGVLGSWRASYTPGTWLVLCGPSTAVVLEPADASWTDLVETLWTEVVAAGSIGDLAARLAAYRIDTMPSFAAFFWGPDGMRSLVRGEVRVLDAATGAIIAHGRGVQTWTEVGLGALLRVRVDLPGEAGPVTPALPLVVGVVGASSLVLDASAAARLTSPQGAGPIALGTGDVAREADDQPAEDAAPEEEAPEEEVPEEEVPEEEVPEEETPEEEAPEVPEHAEGLATELVDPFEDERMEHENAQTRLMPVPGSDPPPPPPRANDPATETDSGPTVLAVLCPWEHPNRPGTDRCRICTAGIEVQRPRAVPPPVLALLRATNGEVVALDRPVLVGRAPSPDRSQVDDPELLVLSSPSHDISRTHLEIVPADWRVTLTDLHSTNGTIVTTHEGTTRQLEPGESVVLELGSAVELADGVSVLIDFPQ